MSFLSILAISNLLAALGDLLTTLYALSKGFREANPVAAWVMKHSGKYGWAILRLATSLVTTYFLFIWNSPIFLLVLSLLTWFVVVSNVKVLTK